MSVKTTGAEFKRFYEDEEFWPDGTWHEDETLLVDGCDVSEYGIDHTTLADDAQITLAGGVVLGPGLEGKEPSFESYFEKWRKKQTTTTFLVECDVAKVAAVKEAVKAAGGVVK